MPHMSCPSCGLDLMVRRDERPGPGGYVCPRCLARSSGAISVRLRAGSPPPPVPLERRVLELLRRHAGGSLRYGS